VKAAGDVECMSSLIDEGEIGLPVEEDDDSDLADLVDDAEDEGVSKASGSTAGCGSSIV